MHKIISCRRTFVAVFAVTCLTVIALINGTDTSIAIASVAVGIAGANAYQKAKAGDA